MLMSPETAAELARLRAERDGTVALSPAGTAYLAAIRARHAAIEGGGWHLAPEPHVEPGTVRTMVGGYQRIIGVFDFRGAPATADANRQFVLYAPSDVGFLLGQMDRLRARVAEVEKQLAAAVESPLAWAEQLDAKSLDNFLISLGQATEYEPMNGAISYIHELLTSFRVAVAALGGEGS